MSNSSLPRPPFDPAYKVAGGFPGWSDVLDVETARKTADTSTAQDVLAKHPHVTYVDITIPAITEFGDHSIPLSVFCIKNSGNKSRSVILYVHGGGQVLGNRFHGVEQFFREICPISDDIVFASVEYRRAPEHQAPAGAHDCYAALVYLNEHSAELGVDASKILLYGVSGGAPLAAATCLLARNRKGPQICAQLLDIPMLDDRDHFPSWKQFETGTLWSGTINRQAWDMALGPDRGKPGVDEIRSPGRARDLSSLPPTYIEVGECEVFRDSAVAYASQIWQSGGSAELHVWPGMYHGAAWIEPDVPISKAAQAARKNFIERALGFQKGSSSVVQDIAQTPL